MEFFRKFFWNFRRWEASDYLRAQALPASLPERVDPGHETCAGLVCPGDLVKVIGVFSFPASESMRIKAAVG
jgi:hypothetical protein